ncbi:MAG: TetR/AcrR family transcriptional regulator [Bacteroidales bacterium]|jgi:AcrR family transcriptional regulator|nr:TetR/AcrR family transcriptional regulator [Bacteroidales bacterium]
MPRTKEQFEEIRQNRKAHIMASAMKLFAEEGYGHVTISTLAKYAGISKGLMYNYFESKDQLLKEIIDSGVHEIMEYFDPNHNGVLTSEEFELFIRKTFQLMHENQEFWMQFFGLMVQPNIQEFLKSSALVKFMEQYFGMFASYFKKMGFEDPMLEVLQLSVIIEGLGVMMFYSKGLTEISPDMFKKLEDRIIKMYT